MTVAPIIESFEQFETTTEKLLIPPFRSSFGAIEWKNRKRPRRRLQYLVEDWLTTAGVSIIGGRSSCGKSFLALHLGLCVARGVDFFGLTVRRCGVVYQAGEGGLGLLDRMEAYAQHFKLPEDEDIPFAMLPGKIDIFTKEKKDVGLFIEEVNDFSKKWQEQFGFAAGFVVIDTLKKAAPGIDEISGKDNAVVLDNVARIERETRCHVCLVHHTNADGKKLRGHTSLRDDVDQVILIEHDKETGIRDAVLDKIKDGEDGRKIRFSLIAVPVRSETMSDGTTKEFTSCAIVTVTEKERLKKEQERQGFTVNATERRMLMNLFDTVDRHGRFIANDKEGPKAAIGKVVVDWKDYLAVAREKILDVDDQSQATGRITKEFKRYSDGLIKYGIIGVSKPYMWWAGKPIRGFSRTFPKNQNSENSGTNTGQTPDNPISPGMADIFDSGGDIVL
ncbi:MAG: AAA family ATPase [Mesorhizobium sp.]|uniref:AAA family ATPase n=1 Tax=Mesorhizobium sp. TaxID=1871066 RepID=UPI000FE56DF9|nr:AAA family ATPase [Mesorhizobium sp.]RWC91676.1 MAG: AAA family ATPase [Mesorhizobium sp.]